jgi:hypothetical protein
MCGKKHGFDDLKDILPVARQRVIERREPSSFAHADDRAVDLVQDGLG